MVILLVSNFSITVFFFMAWMVPMWKTERNLSFSQMYLLSLYSFWCSNTDPSYFCDCIIYTIIHCYFLATQLFPLAFCPPHICFHEKYIQIKCNLVIDELYNFCFTGFAKKSICLFLLWVPICLQVFRPLPPSLPPSLCSCVILQLFSVAAAFCPHHSSSLYLFVQLCSFIFLLLKVKVRRILVPLGWIPLFSSMDGVYQPARTVTS